MVGTIAAFELRQRFRRISTYVYFVVLFGLAFFFQLVVGGAFPFASVDYGTGGRVYANAPYALFAVIVYISTFGVVITAALAGQATYQDVDSNSTQFFFTAPITKFDYLAGRFLGSILVQLVLFSSVGLGALAATHTHWMDPTRVGPERWFAYIAPYFIFVLPNLLITGAAFFALGALARRMLPVYISAVLFLVGYTVAGILAGDVTNSVIASLVDPFGGNPVDYVVRYWTPFQRNTQLIPFTGLILINRLIWLGVGLVLIVFTYARFKMGHVNQAGRKKRRQILADSDEPAPVQEIVVPVLHPAFS
ncbi:MAG TPA: ABC-2 transporter permease, partial [Candidatus Angelobacter sp.]|nr:ABC-2 transporter permease [Candidatus Angelobacter sp.]